MPHRDQGCRGHLRTRLQRNHSELPLWTRRGCKPRVAIEVPAALSPDFTVTRFNFPGQVRPLRVGHSAPGLDRTVNHPPSSSRSRLGLILKQQAKNLGIDERTDHEDEMLHFVQHDTLVVWQYSTCRCQQPGGVAVVSRHLSGQIERDQFSAVDDNLSVDDGVDRARRQAEERGRHWIA
jgi:hypothetical protein